MVKLNLSKLKLNETRLSRCANCAQGRLVLTRDYWAI